MGCGPSIRVPSAPLQSVQDGELVRVRLDDWFEAVFPGKVNDSVTDMPGTSGRFRARGLVSQRNTMFAGIYAFESPQGWSAPKEKVVADMAKASRRGVKLLKGAPLQQGQYAGADMTVEEAPHMLCRSKFFVGDTKAVIAIFCHDVSGADAALFERVSEGFHMLGQ